MSIATVFLYLSQVRTFLAKILIVIAVGLLFSHQAIAHHHLDSEITSNHHDDDHDVDHHGQFPGHYIAHIFSFDNGQIGIDKKPVYDIPFDLLAALVIPRLPAGLKIRVEYLEIRPPLIKWFKYFSLRAPPVV